jgi:hypothetical protein
VEDYLELFVSCTAILACVVSLCMQCCQSKHLQHSGLKAYSPLSASDAQTGSCHAPSSGSHHHDSQKDSILYPLYPRKCKFWKQAFMFAALVAIVAWKLVFDVNWDSHRSFSDQVYQYAWALVPCCQVSVAIMAGLNFDYGFRQSNIQLFFWIMSYCFVILYSVLMWICIEDGEYSLCLVSGSEKFLIVLANVMSVSALFLFLVDTSTLPEYLPCPPTPEYLQGIFGHISFSFMNDTVNLGQVKDSFDVSDSPELFHRDKCKVIFDSIGYEEIEKHPRLLTWRLAGYLKKLVVEQIFYQFFGSVLSFVAPLALRRVLEYTTAVDGIDTDEVPIATGILGILSSMSPWVAVALMFIGPALKCICDGQNYWVGRRMAVNTRSILISVIYKRSLRVDLSAIDEGSGTLNNLMSVDVREISDWLCYSGFLWCTLLEIILCLTLLYQVMGSSCLIGVLLMLLAIPLTAASSKFMDTYQTQLLKKKDERMSVVGEILSGIRIIKVLSPCYELLS